MNDGTCLDTDEGATYICICPINFTGDHCDRQVTEAPQPTPPTTTPPFIVDTACVILEPCNEGGTCIDTDDGSSYRCVYPTTEISATTTPPATTIPVDTACMLLQPCLNGGTCVDTEVDTYHCLCEEGFTGDHCGVDVKDLLIKHPTTPVQTTTTAATTTTSAERAGSSFVDGKACYVCSSDYDDGCELANTPDQYIKKCENGEQYCLKHATTLIDELVVERSCSPILTELHKCDEIQGAENCVTVTTCETDGCNHSNTRFHVDVAVALMGFILTAVFV